MTQQEKLKEAYRHLFLANECLIKGKVADLRGFKDRTDEISDTLNTSLYPTPNEQAEYLKGVYKQQWEKKINNTYEYHLHKAYKLLRGDLFLVATLPNFEDEL